MCLSTDATPYPTSWRPNWDPHQANTPFAGARIILQRRALNRQCLLQASIYFKTCSGDQYAADDGGLELKAVERGWHFGDMTCIMGIEALLDNSISPERSLAARDCACSPEF